MALSKQESTRETTNLARIAQIILGPCTAVLQDVLAKQILPFNVQEKFESFLNKRHIYLKWVGKDEGVQIFSKIKDNPHFNIPLLYTSLRCMCSITQHKNKWGNFPDEEDRSLSANIERIYSLHKEYEQYPNYHLKDSIFEQEWKNAYQTVKELEEYLGSDTKHQETLKNLKTSLMDPIVGKKIIKKLRGRKSRLADKVLESEEEMRAEDTLQPRMEFLSMESEYKSELESESESESEENDKPERTEPVTSKQLRELFNSFEIKFPDHPLIESFASGIFHKDVHNLVTTVNSLSHGVVLPTNTPSNRVLIFEMEVVDDDDQLWVVKKDNSSYAFQKFLDEDNPTKVILITSKAISIVRAKLTVYKKYKHVINERKLFLQHEHEEFDDVAKMIAYQKLMKFCSSVESVINAFSVDLYKTITDYKGRPLTANKIKEMCLKAFSESEHPWDLKHPRSFITEKLPILGRSIGDWKELVRLERTGREWREWVATKIHQKISKKGEIECTDAWSEIWNVCRPTVFDLRFILSELEEFRTRVLPVDQNKQIDKWLKWEIIEDIASLQEYPSVIMCIAGQRDNRNVVKVYISNDKEETKEAFKQKCEKVFRNKCPFNMADVEFVNIGGNIEMPNEIKRIKALEREAPEIDRSTIEELEKIIQEHTDKLYARYSNLIGIRIGRRVHGDKLEEPCILFYCLDKTLIPFGEKKLPETLEGWPCDLREDFILDGGCTANCKTADYPKVGCSIGIPFNRASGSVGFMYKADNSKKFSSGFLTASHVAIKNCHKLHSEKELHALSKHSLGQEWNHIVHPSWIDSGYVNNIVGQVREAFYGNNEFSGKFEGLDIAFVETKCRNEENDMVEVCNEDKRIFKKRVKKTGRTTGETYGLLSGKMLSVRIQRLSGNSYKFYSVYVVDKMPQEERPFFALGDCGSGVFVVEDGEPDKAIGIGIAVAQFSQETYVCKISKILNILGLKLVRDHENNKEQTLPSIKKM